MANARRTVAFNLMVMALITLVANAAPTLRAEQPAQAIAATQPADEPTPTTQADNSPEPMSINYYVKPRSYGVQPESEPPKYVRTLSKTGIPALKDLYWLDFGIDHRTRFEYRQNDYRKPVMTRDTPFLLRSRGYLGIREIADPFRMGVEFLDARILNSKFPIDNRDEDENDILQLFGELYFEDALGLDRPLRFQAGRLAFEYLDRRMISRNPWRNTANNFDGFRAILGQERNDWQLDILALQPVERRTVQPDRTDEEEWFYGVIGQWRRWSKFITLQPYYLVRDRDQKGWNNADIEIHNLALRGYGDVGDTGWDYDFNTAWQFGDFGEQKQRAWGATGEIGYTFDHPWKPRLSGFFGYGSGDREPYDNINQRFDRFYGFARPWSASDYIIWENVITPKVHLEWQPLKNIRFDTGAGAYWLASDTDVWPNARRRDPTGQSGDCIGQEYDIRMRWQVDPRVELVIGYAYFIPGVFAQNTGPAGDSDFFYVEANVQLFE